MRKYGYIAEVEVIIPWMPVKCVEFKVFNYSLKICSQQKTKEVKMKPKLVEDSVVDAINVEIRGKTMVVDESHEGVGFDVLRTSVEELREESVFKEDDCSVTGSKKSSSKRKKAQRKGGSQNKFLSIKDDAQVSRLIEKLDLAVHTRKPRAASQGFVRLTTSIIAKKMGAGVIDKGSTKVVMRGPRSDNSSK